MLVHVFQMYYKLLINVRCCTLPCGSQKQPLRHRALVFCILNQHEHFIKCFICYIYYLYVQYFLGFHVYWFFLGALFAILASAESLCNFCSQLIFNPLYTWTIHELKGKFVAGITFFINAGILLIPMVLIG